MLRFFRNHRLALALVAMAGFLGLLLATGNFNSALAPLTNAVPTTAAVHVVPATLRPTAFPTTAAPAALPPTEVPTSMPLYHPPAGWYTFTFKLDEGVGYASMFIGSGTARVETPVQHIDVDLGKKGMLALHHTGVVTVTGYFMHPKEDGRLDEFDFEVFKKLVYEVYDMWEAPVESFRVLANGKIESIVIDGR